jgi:hypothetical protein
MKFITDSHHYFLDLISLTTYLTTLSILINNLKTRCTRPTLLQEETTLLNNSVLKVPPNHLEEDTYM